MEMPHVVVLGGGFGGLWATRALANADVRITLVDRSNHHLFQPLLYQVATAGLSAPDIAAPLRHLLRRQRNVEVRLDEVRGIDLDAHRVVLDGGTRKELGEYLGVGTNNIAELVAIERGLALAFELTKGDPNRPMRVYSDSSYAIGLLDKGWKAKANQELVARIRKAITVHRHLAFVKVSGHAGVPENERCDELARRAVSRGLMR